MVFISLFAVLVWLEWCKNSKTTKLTGALTGTTARTVKTVISVRFFLFFSLKGILQQVESLQPVCLLVPVVDVKITTMCILRIMLQVIDSSMSQLARFSQTAVFPREGMLAVNEVQQTQIVAGVLKTYKSSVEKTPSGQGDTQLAYFLLDKQVFGFGIH